MKTTAINRDQYAFGCSQGDVTAAHTRIAPSSVALKLIQATIALALK
jgi:hypothetical protein